MSLTDKLNKTGYCIICDETIYDPVSVYPTNHPWKGKICTVKKPLKNCHYVTLELANGSVTTVTACTHCAAKAYEWNLEEIHDVLLKTWEWEQSDKFRSWSNLRTLTEEQKKTQRQWLEGQLDNILLAVLAVAKTDLH